MVRVCNTTGWVTPTPRDYKPPLNLSGVTVTDDPSGNVHNIGTLNAADCKGLFRILHAQ